MKTKMFELWVHNSVSHLGREKRGEKTDGVTWWHASMKEKELGERFY